MTELEKLRSQLEQLNQKIEEQAEQDAIAGYGWGCSDKSWALNRAKYALIKQIQDLTNR
jgi:hypothetical protein